MTQLDSASVSATGARHEIRRVVLAAALGTLFEWYDFFIYGSLAVFFGGLFFPKGNESAAILASLATFGAGFILRPFGAVFFGWIGDLVGRKRTFFVTMLIMGLATALVGLLPTFESIGWAAPATLVALRLFQGLAIGGEFGGAVTYIAEHAGPRERGFLTSWLQITGTLGLLLSLALILLLRSAMSSVAFASWGWRIPFLVSIVLLAWSLYIRSRLHESPVFIEMKAQGTRSTNPLRETLGSWANIRRVIVVIFGAVAGQAVIWYTGHFYALQFMTASLKIAPSSAYLYLTIALVLATPFFVIFGWLSDRIGRKPIMLAGCFLSAVFFVPLFHALALYGNPSLMEFRSKTSVVIEASDCRDEQTFIGQLFQPKATSPCTVARAYLTAQSVPYTIMPAQHGLRILINGRQTASTEPDTLARALSEAGMPSSADPARTNSIAVVAALFAIIFFATMVYGPLG